MHCLRQRTPQAPASFQDDEDMEYDDEDEEEEAAAAEGEEDDIVPLDAVSFEVAIVKEGSDKTLV